MIFAAEQFATNLATRNVTISSGSFNMPARAEIFVMQLEPYQVRELAIWIRDRNLDDTIPIVRESFIAKLFFVASD